MYRLLIVLAVASLLSACASQGDEASDAPPASSPMSASASPDASDAGTGTASSECTDAFADVEAAGVSDITELGDLQAEVAPTVESCESLDEWVAAAQDVIGDDVNPNTAALLLRMNCGDLSLANTPLCQELASS